MSGRPPTRQGLTAWIRGFVGLMVEIEAGMRPVRHLRPFLSAPLQHAVHSRRGADPHTVVRQVLLQRHGDLAHAVVLLESRGRVSALALTIVRDRYGPVVADLGRPEDGLLRAPDPPGAPALASEGWRSPTVTASVPHWQVPRGWPCRQAAAARLASVA